MPTIASVISSIQRIAAATNGSSSSARRALPRADHARRGQEARLAADELREPAREPCRVPLRGRVARAAEDLHDRLRRRVRLRVHVVEHRQQRLAPGRDAEDLAGRHRRLQVGRGRGADRRAAPPGRRRARSRRRPPRAGRTSPAADPRARDGSPAARATVMRTMPSFSACLSSRETRDCERSRRSAISAWRRPCSWYRRATLVISRSSGVGVIERSPPARGAAGMPWRAWSIARTTRFMPLSASRQARPPRPRCPRPSARSAASAHRSNQSARTRPGRRASASAPGARWRRPPRRRRPARRGPCAPRR